MKVLAVVLLLTFAWATPAPPNSVPFPGLESLTPEAPPDVTEVRLARSRCLTDCPAYTVTLRRDGSFSYHGEYATMRSGEHSGQVERGQLWQVFRYIDEIDFMDLESRYRSPYRDNATTVITIVQNGERKTVTNDGNSGPATLWALEQLIGGLLESAFWDARSGTD